MTDSTGDLVASSSKILHVRVVYPLQMVYLLSVVFLLIIQHYEIRSVAFYTLYLFLHHGLYSRKRSIVYKDADVDLIIFINATIKVLFVAL